MAECDWAILCDYAFLDSGGKMCMIGVFDRIFAKRVPTTHLRASLVVRLRGESSEGVTVRIEIVRPTKTVLKRVEGSGEMSTAGSAGLQLDLAPLQLPDWGEYVCNIFVNDVLSYTLMFTVASPPSGAS